MDRPDIAEILASLEGMRLTELQKLVAALSERYASATRVIPEEELRAREEEARAYWTPAYSLILVSLNCRPEDKAALIKKIRELRGCTLKEAKEMVENPAALPLALCTLYHEHPSEAREKLREAREELEALGAVMDEDYNYGYFD